MRVLIPTWAAACLALVAGGAAQAQAPAKAASAAARPAARGTATISGNAPTGNAPVLTRDELRACLAQQDALKARLDTATASRRPLDDEKAQIATEQQALTAARAPIDDYRRQADALSARMKDYGERAQSWNQRVNAFNESSQTGPQAEQKRGDLNREREELEKQQKEIEAERLRLNSAGESLIGPYNARAVALDTRIGDWNRRNAAWNEQNDALEDERKDWQRRCADRRYREDDETAIRKGK